MSARAVDSWLMARPGPQRGGEIIPASTPRNGAASVMGGRTRAPVGLGNSAVSRTSRNCTRARADLRSTGQPDQPVVPSTGTPARVNGVR